MILKVEPGYKIIKGKKDNEWEIIKESPNFEFFKVKKSHINQWGERYFCCIEEQKIVIQVVVKLGKNRRGPSNQVGVYAITPSGFFSNIAWKRERVEHCTQDEFNKAAQLILHDLIGDIIE